MLNDETLGGPYAWGSMEPQFYGPMDPMYPCHHLPTRHCPAVYETCCVGMMKKCARYELREIGPWLPELGWMVS